MQLFAKEKWGFHFLSWEDIANLALGRVFCRIGRVSPISAVRIECDFLTQLLLFQLGRSLEKLAFFIKNLEVTKSFENGP